MKSVISKILFVLFFYVPSTFAQDKKFNGYATAKVNHDSIQEINTYGFADKERKIAYSENSIQPIGSVSKTFIGISLMIAKEKGLLDLDADINTYLDFTISNPHLKEKNIITLRHLATHTSGIIDDEKIYENSYTFKTNPKNSLRDFFINNLSKDKKITKKLFYKSKAGERYSYSNIGAALAAYIIEKVSGKPFSQFTNETIFIPLKMKNTGWFQQDVDSTKLATLYDEKDIPLKSYSCDTYPDGSLKTTINDLSLYLIELIKGYNGNASLLSKSSWKEFYSKNFTGSSIPSNIDTKEPNTGMFIIYFKSNKIGHTGSDLGVSCFLMFDPVDNTGKIFMANEDIVKSNVETFKTIWNTF